MSDYKGVAYARKFPDSKLVYISNASMRSVTAIDMKAMKVVAEIPVGEVPKRINTMVMN